ncbi:citrulline utilization hydrolase CtlX [Arcticibacterium luteifluviistationis]|uniref:Amidinotransferase n=1 Tax=Arcticibacterium luteifluviistationis TaxID=1784714 RepID=A0A2Z4G6P1_9BACT|nr:arginine deiminase-related protein [Arcticibacterium luteifluviistationis]AWV96827.1 amidinotransferase [Arcticibacterium luteifluviistationis]
MEKQCCSHLMMVRPVCFGFNEQTAESNAFMHEAEPNENPQEDALKHFDEFVAKLRKAKVNITVIEDTPEPCTPDSIFPNNWVSFHADGRVFLYPMEARNRRAERSTNLLNLLESNFNIESIHHLEQHENNKHYLEGTGSLVLDRSKKVAYACLSSRTHESVIEDWASHFPDYEIVTFDALDEAGVSIYHTNVMMNIGADFSLICAESIRDITQRNQVLNRLKESGKEPLEISLAQMNEFAGNMLQVENIDGERILVMSERAYQSLNKSQIAFLEERTFILRAELGLIETLGGGSARCMLAEIHLPLKA